MEITQTVHQGGTDTEKVVCTHTGIFLSLEKDILTHVTTCRNLEGVTFSEIGQTLKDKYGMSPLT